MRAKGGVILGESGWGSVFSEDYRIVDNVPKTRKTRGKGKTARRKEKIPPRSLNGRFYIDTSAIGETVVYSDPSQSSGWKDSLGRAPKSANQVAESTILATESHRNDDRIGGLCFAPTIQ